MRDALGEVQTVLVLGGTSDIAVATCRRLAAGRTRRIVLGVRDPGAAAPVVDVLREAGADEVEAVAFDATDYAGHAAFVAETFDRLGDIDLVLVAFGVLGDRTRSEHDAELARSVIDTNFTGVVSVAIPISERLRTQGHGTLCVLSSVAGERVRRTNFVYGASKAGVDGFAQGLGAALADSGARVMIVRPGFVPTKMTAGLSAAPFATTADAVAEVIVRGLARGSDIVWAPPVLRLVMSALRHLPTPIFRRLPQ
ncbi:MAG: decaprenylphospho-beta-D-erythro-pentofuranosid-2-ulose 2-reductase [Actinomycetota bacterium]